MFCSSASTSEARNVVTPGVVIHDTVAKRDAPGVPGHFKGLDSASKRPFSALFRDTS
jgi:hypothetical protein